MKKIGTLLVLICFLILIATVGSCKKEKVIPTLTTNPVTGITTNSGTSGGVISSDGGAAVTARGVCWATSVNPVVSGSHTSDDKGTGSFTSEMTALDANTLYHVRAYATNSEGTAYGKEVTFSTSAIALASLTTQAVTLVTQKTAVSGGSISSDGGGAITARGVCWSTATGPTTTDNKTSDATGTGDFISNLAGLLPGVKYYIRSYATNVAGTSYGNELSFTTNPVVLPTVTTTIASAITLTTAVSGGNVTNDGGGAIIERGVCWAATVNPTITNSKATSTAGTGVFVTNLSGLTPGATYHIRAYATNSAGTAYGEDLNFITSAIVIPTLTTTAISGLTSTSAISGGNISADGGGSVTARGVCWATTLNPTTSNSKTSDATGTGIFVSNLTALTPRSNISCTCICN